MLWVVYSGKYRVCHKYKSIFYDNYHIISFIGVRGGERH